MVYQIFIVLDGKEFQVETTKPANEEEAQQFVDSMSKMARVNYISTYEGILSYDVKDVQSVYYIARKCMDGKA